MGKEARSKANGWDFEAKIYVNAKKWYASVPLGYFYQKIYDSKTEYPLVVNYNIMEVVYGTDNLIQLDATQHRPTIVYCEKFVKNILFYILPRVYKTAVSEGISDESGEVVCLVFEAMDHLEKEYNIDKRR